MSILPFDQLRSRLCGPSFTPADADYETSREIWNRLYDRRSSAVVRCESVSDVVAAVRFAREYDLEIAVRGGGHHAAGYASTNGGILLNLAGMRTVSVSPAQQHGSRRRPGLPGRSSTRSTRLSAWRVLARSFP